MSSTDTSSSSVNISLKLNGWYLVNCDSGNALMRSGVSSFGARESVVVKLIIEKAEMTNLWRWL